MHVIMKTSRGIRSSRPLRAMLAGLLLCAMTAAAEKNPPEDSADPVRPPAPADLKVEQTMPENCVAILSWTQSNPDNIQLKGFEYRTIDVYGDLEWGEWLPIGGGASIRKASLTLTGGNRVQLRVTVSQEGADDSEGGTLLTVDDLDPDHPKCQ